MLIFNISKNSTHKIITIMGIKLKIRIYKENKDEQIISEILRARNNIYKMISVAEKHKYVFTKFKNIYCNKSIAIIGCGPSLNYYNPIEEVDINIALKRALEFDKIKFNYLFWSDARNNGRKYLKEYQNYNCVKFYGEFINWLPKYTEKGRPHIPESDVIRDSAYRFYSNAHIDIIYPDISTSPLADYGTIAHCALHFALWTNPKKIYLIGCDNSNMGYFNSTNKNGADLLEYSFYGYKKIKEFASIYYPDTEIISVNPVGLKGIFTDIYTEEFKNSEIYKTIITK